MRKTGGMIRYGFVVILLIIGVCVLVGMEKRESRELLALVEDASGNMEMLEDQEVFEAEVQTEGAETPESGTNESGAVQAENMEGQMDDSSDSDDTANLDDTVDSDQAKSENIPTIRVLLTDQTGDGLRTSAYLTCDQPFFEAGHADQVYEAGQVFAVHDFLSGDQTRGKLCSMETSGCFSLTDASGKAVSLPYHGFVELYRTEGGCYLVNEVPIEQYLYSVVSSEMPASFSPEALKAQAICARTFADKAKGSDAYAAWNADLDDSVNSQVYNKQSPEDVVRDAVDQTAGEILTFEGEPIQAYFFSTSCGYTSGLKLWAQEDVAYLTEVCLSNVGESVDFDRFIRDTTVSAFDDASPYFRWQAQLDLSKLGVTSIRVASRASSGAVTDLELSGSGKEIHITNEYKLRKELGKAIVNLRDKNGREASDTKVLPSAYFSIEQTGDQITLYGGGYGHGIGLSQYGADGMAQEGYDYKEILETFYPGTSLTSIQ